MLCSAVGVRWTRQEHHWRWSSPGTTSSDNSLSLLWAADRRPRRELLCSHRTCSPGWSYYIFVQSESSC